MFFKFEQIEGPISYSFAPPQTEAPQTSFSILTGETAFPFFFGFSRTLLLVGELRAFALSTLSLLLGGRGLLFTFYESQSLFSTSKFIEGLHLLFGSQEWSLSLIVVGKQPRVKPLLGLLCACEWP